MSGSSMSRTNRLQCLDLHPVVYGLLIGSTVWVVLAFWLFFSHDAYTAFQLVIVTFFMAMFIGVPVAMVRTARKPAKPNQVSFGDWRAGDLQTYTGPVPAGQAALMVLIAPMAAVVGITAISAIAYMAAMGIL